MARCDSYATGECTDGACRATSWVPDYLGDGGDWAANAPGQGLQVTAVPTTGSIVCYGKGDGYSAFGHCALVTAVYPDGNFAVWEMNYVAWDQYDARVSNAYDVVGFVLPPGVSPGQGSPGPGPGGGDPVSDLMGAWSTLAGDWNQTLPQHINRLRAVHNALGQF